MEEPNAELIFVYNAKSGFLNSVTDLLRKTVSPTTYPCKLCRLTYDGATMNKAWKNYLAGLSMPAKFLHRDEFTRSFPGKNLSLPAILLSKDSELVVLLGSNDFKTIDSLEGLIQKLSYKLKSKLHKINQNRYNI